MDLAVFWGRTVLCMCTASCVHRRPIVYCDKRLPMQSYATFLNTPLVCNAPRRSNTNHLIMETRSGRRWNIRRKEGSSSGEGIRWRRLKRMGGGWLGRVSRGDCKLGRLPKRRNVSFSSWRVGFFTIFSWKTGQFCYFQHVCWSKNQNFLHFIQYYIHILSDICILALSSIKSKICYCMYLL